ncbi:MAG: hypothetical protein QOJ32_3283 [Frankiaceae bacterium]|jgi:hypothetical protein|nr:hypothetical protein [Frankiaceae bacterium]MDQ1636474.1 hypothetical protein [Frankiaceae bacterium]MDQ1648262.1 hypothetical protein [Frankiaceae bacterium]MDQ1672650.1 hypothetical protein [Frankiaceae bacterium]
MSSLSASPLGGTGAYVHWGVIQISVANLVVIVLMLIVLALAIVLPFPHGKNERGSRHED